MMCFGSKTYVNEVSCKTGIYYIQIGEYYERIGDDDISDAIEVAA